MWLELERAGKLEELRDELRDELRGSAEERAGGRAPRSLWTLSHIIHCLEDGVTTRRHTVHMHRAASPALAHERIAPLLTCSVHRRVWRRMKSNTAVDDACRCNTCQPESRSKRLLGRRLLRLLLLSCSRLGRLLFRSTMRHGRPTVAAGLHGCSWRSNRHAHHATIRET